MQYRLETAEAAAAAAGAAGGAAVAPPGCKLWPLQLTALLLQQLAGGGWLAAGSSLASVAASLLECLSPLALLAICHRCCCRRCGSLCC
jgi:hypothetical protein